MKEILSDILKKNAFNIVKWMVAGGTVTIFAIVMYGKFFNEIDKRLSDSKKANIEMIRMQHLDNRRILNAIVDRIGQIDSAVNKDNRTIRNENFRLWKENLNLKNENFELKKNDYYLNFNSGKSELINRIALNKK